jgi:prepilin-type N-terminal cleavage/methylation domain-containing protein
MKKQNSGFTVIELSVVMGIFLILLTLSFINLTPLPSRATVTSSTQNLIADLRATQTQAMSGDTKGGTVQSDYGVHFEGGSYWLFKGSVFNPSDITNFKVDLGDVNVSFNTITFVFEKGSGEVATPGNIVITNSLTNEVTTININKYGAPTY